MSLKEQIIAVRDSGKTNMLDSRTVQYLSLIHIYLGSGYFCCRDFVGICDGVRVIVWRVCSGVIRRNDFLNIISIFPAEGGRILVSGQVGPCVAPGVGKLILSLIHI